MRPQQAGSLHHKVACLPLIVVQASRCVESYESPLLGGAEAEGFGVGGRSRRTHPGALRHPSQGGDFRSKFGMRHPKRRWRGSNSRGKPTNPLLASPPKAGDSGRTSRPWAARGNPALACPGLPSDTLSRASGASSSLLPEHFFVQTPKRIRELVHPWMKGQGASDRCGLDCVRRSDICSLSLP